MGIAEDAAGAIYISDRDRFVWKVEPSGKATVIAGNGLATGPGGLPSSRTHALQVALASPEGLLVEPTGDILLADSYNNAILRIDSEGYLSRFAGNGIRGYNGDGNRATESSLRIPHDVRIDSKGNVYIADVMNHRVRKVDREGIMTTVAGTGVVGYSGDGGPAVDAQLNTPWGILVTPDDHLLIADSENHVIRRVGSDGIIVTIAGSGELGFDGDGGPALSAKFNSPQSLALDAMGRLYIGDEHNNAIRMIEQDGRVSTLIGTQGPGFSGDGGPAHLAQIADPENILVRKDGSILITARDNSRIRLVSPDGIISTFAGKGPTSRHDYYAPIRLPTVEPYK
jgi:sugar lactone lactonase YvrE